MLIGLVWMSWRKGFLAFCKLLSGDPPEPEPSHQGTHAPSAGSRQTFPRPRPQSWEPQTAENLRKEKVSFLKVEEAVRWSCEPLRGGVTLSLRAPWNPHQYSGRIQCMGGALPGPGAGWAKCSPFLSAAPPLQGWLVTSALRHTVACSCR